MVFVSKIHGNLNYEEKNRLTFKKSLLGFDNLKKFILVDLEGCKPFKILQSLEDEEMALIVTCPFDFYKDYEAKLTEDLIERLEIKDQKEVMLITTVTINSDLKKITTNLKAPIVINTSNKLGEQIILEKVDYEIKHPLIKE